MNGQKRTAAVLLGGGLQALIALRFLTLTPSEAGQGLLLGFSRERWLLILPLLGLALLGGAGAAASFRSAGFAERLSRAARSPRFQLALLASMLGLSLAVLAAGPSRDVLLKLLPLGLFLWLAGIEILVLFPDHGLPISGHSAPGHPRREAALAAAGVLALLLAVLLPSHVPARLDGLPWNTPAEFILAAAAAPFALLLAWRAFARPWVLLPLGLALVLKIGLAAWAPAAGIDAWAYRSPEAMRSGRWERGYSTLLQPGTTARMERAFRHIREFPMEWINQRFEESSYWIGLRLRGAIDLREGECLVLVQEGMSGGSASLVGIDRPGQFPVPVLGANAPFPAAVCLPGRYQLVFEGVFEGNQNYRLEPRLGSPDGTVADPLQQGRFWRSPFDLVAGEDPASPWPTAARAADLLLAAGVLAALLTAVAQRAWAGQLSRVDLYLGASAPFAYLVLGLLAREDLNLGLHSLTLLFLAVKGLHDLGSRRSGDSPAGWLAALAPLLLAGFLVYDLKYLARFEVFPPGQDGVEYQTYARLIFNEGDFWLQRLPPRGYKLLFPYLVGLLHVLFGDSSVSLYFLSAWCSVLTAATAARITSTLRLPRPASVLSGAVFLGLVTSPIFFTYYYRFGLIEPLSTLLLMEVVRLALEKRLPALFAAGAVTTLLRADYLPAAAAALLLTGDPATAGTAPAVWAAWLGFLRRHWRRAAVYLACLVLVPAGMTLWYRLNSAGYLVNFPDTFYSSAWERPLVLLRVVTGGYPEDFGRWIASSPLQLLAMELVLVPGTLAGILAVFIRRGVLRRIDPRLGLVIAGYLAAYTVAVPVAYFPRFSTPLLPLAAAVMGSLIFAPGLNKNGGDPSPPG